MFNTVKRSPKRNQGFTLIELMIAMSLNLIIAIGAIQALLLVQRLWLLQQGLHKIQENARIIQVYFTHILQSAGALYCNRLDSVTTKYTDVNENALVLSNKGIEVTSIAALKNNPYLNPGFFHRYRDSPILWVWSLEKMDSLSDLNDKIVCINDCTTAHCFKNTLSHAFPPNMGLVKSRLYYIGRTNRTRNKPIYSLYVTELNGTTRELVEGVQAMNITLEEAPERKLKMALLLDSVQYLSTQKWWHFEWVF